MKNRNKPGESLPGMNLKSLLFQVVAPYYQDIILFTILLIMIDTIRVVWPHDTIHHSITPRGWQITNFHQASCPPDGCTKSRSSQSFNHIPSGLRATAGRYSINVVQVSLPRLLFGHNGNLIKSQDEIDQAISKASGILDSIAIPNGGIDHFTRVDLVWQFKMDPERVILAHRTARHPFIRRNAGRYDGQSQYWHGSGLHIRMYDKQLEATRKPGNVVRIEFEVKGELLKKLFGGAPLNRLDFNQCYQVFRDLMLGFCPAKVPDISDVAGLLALAEAEDFKNGGGVSLFDAWALSKNPEHVRRVQKQIASIRPDYFHIDWSQILPVDGPPEPVEVI